MPKKNPVDTDQPVDQDALLHARGYLSVQEIIQKTGHTAQTIHRWADNGHIESERIGNKRWVKRDSLIAYLSKDGSKQAELFGFVEPSEKKRKKD